ncbi:hypothetical protein ACIBSV_37700 [Embleya sp. NPDC050154]
MTANPPTPPMDTDTDRYVPPPDARIVATRVLITARENLRDTIATEAKT